MADYWRQLDLVSPSQLGFPMTVIGVGGIGSPTALALTKMGCRQLSLYDPDTVEAHNLPNQLYRAADLGRPKVEALRELLLQFEPEAAVKALHQAVGTDASLDAQHDKPSTLCHPERSEGSVPQLRGIVISAVDSMAAREAIWRECIRYRAGIPMYIDARMGAQVCRVLTVNPADPEDVRAYEQTLYTDEAATEDPCTAQAIIYTTFGVAALVANQVKRYAQNEPRERDVIFDFVTLSLING